MGGAGPSGNCLLERDVEKAKDPPFGESAALCPNFSFLDVTSKSCHYLFYFERRDHQSDGSFTGGHMLLVQLTHNFRGSIMWMGSFGIEMAFFLPRI
jgi:hypothetical protein